MKFLLGIIVGIFGTLATTMLTSTPAGSIWLRYVQTAITGGVDHAKAQWAVSKYLFDPYTAQFDDLRTVSYENHQYVCGYVNAKNKMGAYIGKHEFVYDPFIDLAIVDDDSDMAKALKERFQPCSPDSLKTPSALKSNAPVIKPEEFPVSTGKADPSTPIPKPPSTSPEPITTPAWTVFEEKSKIDDSSNVFLSSSSKEPLRGRFGVKGSARITIACREGKTNLWISFGGHFMSDSQFGVVTYRVDKRPAKKRHFRESTDHQALGLWSAGEAISFVKELYGGTTLFIEATPHSESSVTAEFEITGLEQAIEPLGNACKWQNQAKPKPIAKSSGPTVLQGAR